MKDAAPGKAPKRQTLADAVRDAMSPSSPAPDHALRVLRLALALTGARDGALASAGGEARAEGATDPRLDRLAEKALDDEAGEAGDGDRLARRMTDGPEGFAVAIRAPGGGAALAVAWERLTLLQSLCAQRAALAEAGFDFDLVRAGAAVAAGDWSAAQDFANRLRAAAAADAAIIGVVEDRAVARFVVSDAPAFARSGASDDALRARLTALARGDADEDGLRVGAAHAGHAVILIGAKRREPALKSVGALFALPRGRRPVAGRLRRWRGPLIAAAVLIGLLFAPLPDAVEAPAEVTSEIRRTVTAPISAPLAEMLVEEGDAVSEGDVIARFDAADLELSLSESRARLAATLAKQQDARRRRDEAARRDAELEMEQIRARIAQTEALRDAATLRATVSGLIAKDLGQSRVGSSFSVGEPVADIVGAEAPMIQAWIDERDRARVTVGERAVFRADAAPENDIAASVERIAVIGETRGEFTVFRVDLKPDALAEWAPGMQGVAAFDPKRVAAGRLLWSRLRDWLALRFLI